MRKWLGIDDGERHYVVDVPSGEARHWVEQYRAGGYVALGPFRTLAAASRALAAHVGKTDDLFHGVRQ